MNNRTIIFRADGNQTIGMGHFTRTLALAEMLNQNFHCVFATRSPSVYQVSEINKVCPNYINLPEDDTHFDTFLNYLNGEEIIVLDNYYFTTKYQETIKEKGCRLVCIDDMHNKHYVADIVINHAEGMHPDGFSVEKNTQLLLGYGHALLRAPFLSTNHEGNYTKKYSGLIIMGGADPINITQTILNILFEFNLEKPIAIVGNKDSIKVPENMKNDNFRFFSKLSSIEILQLMQSSVFGILPASTVAIEACAARLPFICGYFVNNQHTTYNGIVNNNLAIGVGDFSSLTYTSLYSAINRIKEKEVQNKINNHQKELMDKQSKQRILKAFLELC